MSLYSEKKNRQTKRLAHDLQITTKNDNNLVCSIASAAATKIILLATISCQVLSHNFSITSAVLIMFTKHILEVN